MEIKTYAKYSMGHYAVLTGQGVVVGKYCLDHRRGPKGSIVALSAL